MKPQADYLLNTVAANLATKYVPKMAADNEMAELTLMSLLMGAVSEEFDRAAHRRIEENLALKNLFVKSLPVLNDEDLKTRLEAAINEKESDWRISTLDKATYALIELLIELHAHIEALDTKDSQKLDQAIWAELKNYSRRREFAIWELSEAMKMEAQKASIAS